MSAPGDPLPDDFPSTGVGEIKRTVGPIVKALADVVSPEREGLPDRGYKERLGIDFEAIDPNDDDLEETKRADTMQRRAGVHAAACLAREAFGCPGLEMYDYGIGQGGVFSHGFDNALDDMGSLDGVGGMEWDRDGKFAGFLSKRGRDTRWMIAAAAIVLASSKLRTKAGGTGRNDALEEAHFCCWMFTREYLSQVYGELVPHVWAGEPR